MNGNSATTDGSKEHDDEDNDIYVVNVSESCSNDSRQNRKRRLDGDSLPVTTATLTSSSTSSATAVLEDYNKSSNPTRTTTKAESVKHATDGPQHQQQQQQQPFHPPNNTNHHQKKSKIKKKHMDPSVLQFRTTVQKCCKDNDLYTAMNAYHSAISQQQQQQQQQIRIEPQTFYNLLHLCSNNQDSFTATETSTTTNNEMGNFTNDGDRVVATTKIHIGTPKPTYLNSAAALSTSTNASGVATHQNTSASDRTTSVLPSTTLLNDNDEQNVTKQQPLPKFVSIHDRRIFAERVKQHMDQLQIPLTENAYTALVRVYCQGNFNNNCSKTDRNNETINNDDDNVTVLVDAERIISEAEGKQQCRVKLRLYTPLLQTYCELGLLHHAVQIWVRISKQQLLQEHGATTLRLTEVEYCSLLQCCCRTTTINGRRHDRDSIATTAASAAAATIVFERVLSDLAEDVCIPSHTTRQTIVRWFQSEFAVLVGDEENITLTSNNNDVVAIKDLLLQIQVPSEQSDATSSCMGPVQCKKSDQEGSGWTVSDQCRIDTTTGRLLSGCLQNSTLQPILISQQTWDTMKQMNENIAITNKINDTDTTNFQGGGKGRKVTLDDRTIQQRREHWRRFHSFLLTQPDVGVLIDGANVGYYDQNFNGAPKHVDYNQINWMVQHLLRTPVQTKANKVLLIMHSRHFASNLMPQYAQPIVKQWKDMNILYQTPPGMNDDWFWLHAALQYGPGTCIVTNDEMRDHHFQMIAPRSFVRWRDRHQIHFTFGQWIQPGQKEPPDGGSSEVGRRRNSREVVLHYPDPYSRRIQRILPDGLVIPLPKRGDTNRFMDGVFVADDTEPSEEMYLCIRPTRE